MYTQLPFHIRNTFISGPILKDGVSHHCITNGENFSKFLLIGGSTDSTKYSAKVLFFYAKRILLANESVACLRLSFVFSRLRLKKYYLIIAYQQCMNTVDPNILLNYNFLINLDDIGFIF